MEYNFLSSIINRLKLIVIEMSLRVNIAINIIDSAFYNIQNDAINCGYHICLIAESYLMNNSITHLNNLSINNEKVRINNCYIFLITIHQIILSVLLICQFQIILIFLFYL